MPIIRRLIVKRPPRGERDPGPSTLAIMEVPHPHERERDAFEPWAIRPALHSIQPLIAHILDEGPPFWEIWFIHEQRPIVLRISSPGVGELTMDELSDYLSLSVRSEKHGTATPAEKEAAWFARRVREFACGERWPEPAPPTG